MTETVPVFLMSGDTISDVLYLPFTENDDQSWTCTGSAELVVTHDIDWAVFESPIGCFEMYLPVRAKTRLTFVEGPGDGTRYLRPCQRTRPIEQEATVAH